MEIGIRKGIQGFLRLQTKTVGILFVYLALTEDLLYEGVVL